MIDPWFDIKALPEDFFDDPYPTYTRLREETPVLPQTDGSFVLSRYADLDRIYRDTKLFSSDKTQVFLPKFGDTPLYEHHTTSLVFNDPPLHSRVRKIMVGAMSARAIARMEPGLERLVDELISELGDSNQSRGEVDLVEQFAMLIPINIIGNLFDMPWEEREPLRAWSLAILGALEPVLTEEQQTKGNQAVTDFCAYLRDLVARRRKNPGDPEVDVLTRLMQSEAGELSEIELLQNCIFILNAGHETTTNLIANGLALLNDHPQARTDLIANPALLTTAVDEILRLESPNQFGNRLTTEDVQIGDTLIPKGRDLHLCIGAANRDPRIFDSADAPVLSRRPNKHFAFAGGPHTCVGLSLARLEGRVALGRFLSAFPNYQITGRTRAPRLRFRGFEHLTATLT